MKVATVFALLLVSANAFTAPQFATRAVGAPKKVAAVKKVVAKKVAPVKAAVKKAAPKVVAKAKKVVVAKKPLISQIKSSKVSSGRKSTARPEFEM